LTPDLQAIRNILNIEPNRILRFIRVYHRNSLPKLNQWQQTPVATLNARADAPADATLEALLDDMVTVPAASAKSTLHHIQSTLFTTTTSRKPLDNSLQWLGCRDYLQEAEITAGMIQKAMAADTLLKCNDFALLLPSDERYRQAVSDIFTQSGLPLSGIGREIAGRDIGREAVYYFLLCKQGLAPAMALATILTSPLMPWTIAEGHRFAQKVIKGDFKLNAPEDAGFETKVMLPLIKKNISTTAELADALEKFVTRLCQCRSSEDPLYASRKRAEESVRIVTEIISGAVRSIDDELWKELLRICQPQSISIAIKSENSLTREGVAVFHEGDEPWRRVRHLFVLGCSDGHYPTQAVRSPVFFDADLEMLNKVYALNLDTSEQRGKRQREVFRRQLCAASDEVTFLIPRRDGMGKQLAPSPALAFMASFIDGIKDDEQLILDLDSDAGRKEARGLALANDRDADTVWKPLVEDLELGADLVALKGGDESPSRLEKLMVSPLAWLLERMKIESQEWVPEQLDVAAKGTLAHAVFEELFAYGRELPDNDNIAEQVPLFLDEKITAIFPFLKHDEWKVEREHLVQDIIKAAERWSEILKGLNATVIATEVSLKGVLKLGAQGNLSVHGNADLLLELPNNRLFVVDYKKSTSKDRRLRMKAGYDHQATLYRAMIETGGLEYPDKVRAGLVEDLAGFRDAGEICALYYLMNDKAVLTDSSGWLGGSFPGQPEMGAGISREALPLIEKRIGQVRRGMIELNSDSDEKEFMDNRGINPKYTLDISPIVRIFMRMIT
ncbi:MAG: PD-(D/E)XK nuclease family protein, partial [Deltaproteobacteria bacterium]